MLQANGLQIDSDLLSLSLWQDSNRNLGKTHYQGVECNRSFHLVEFVQNKLMKHFKTFIGVDISKLTLDICMLQEQQTEHFKIDNEIKSIERFFKKLQLEETDTCITMENTGRYNVKLLAVLAMRSFIIYVVPPLHIAKKTGLVRGKNDKIDANRIAKFAQKEYQDLKPWQPKREIITELQILLTERKRLINCMKDFKIAAHELEMFEKSFAAKTSRKMHKQMLNAVQKNLVFVEQAIEELISCDEQLAEQTKFITSIKGVGRILCWYLIARTNEFKNINDPRKLACYCGVVPFAHESGSSIRRGNRVSFYADKEMKSLLHMCAMSAVKYEGELRDYYLRKVEEGKNKMSVLNAVRNKIVHRVCAVVNQKKIYNSDLVLS